MFRTNVNEMNVQPINPGNELRIRIEFRLHLAPVVVRSPVANQLLHGRELDALRFVRDRFLFGPLSRGQAPAKVSERLVREVDAEGTDGGGVSLGSEAVASHRW